MKRSLVMLGALAGFVLLAGVLLYEPTCSDVLYRALNSGCFSPR
jgi:hypothetical protein